MRLIFVGEGDTREAIIDQMAEFVQRWNGAISGCGGALGTRARRFDYEFSDMDYEPIYDLVPMGKRCKTDGLPAKTSETTDSTSGEQDDDIS